MAAKENKVLSEFCGTFNSPGWRLSCNTCAERKWYGVPWCRISAKNSLITTWVDVLSLVAPSVCRCWDRDVERVFLHLLLQNVRGRLGYFMKFLPFSRWELKFSLASAWSRRWLLCANLTTGGVYHHPGASSIPASCYVGGFFWIPSFLPVTLPWEETVRTLQTSLQRLDEQS